MLLSSFLMFLLGHYRTIFSFKMKILFKIKTIYSLFSHFNLAFYGCFLYYKRRMSRIYKREGLSCMKGIRKIAPYVPGVQPNSHNMIKINTNENPYPPSPKVAEALKSFDSNQLKRYSSLDNLSLKMALAEKYGVSPEQLMIGNGSDEVLAFSFLAFFNSEDPILFPDITYGFYKVWADLFHIPFKELPLNEAFEIDLQDYEQLNGGLVIANPNAPTGLFKTVEEIRLFLKKQTDVIVIIDEAYVEFAEDSVLSLLDDHPNLIIVRTLSKSQSLAGLRIGYAIGAPEYIAILESIKSSFNHILWTP